MNIKNSFKKKRKELYSILDNSLSILKEMQEKYEDKINLLETEVLWNLMHCDNPLMQASRKEGKYVERIISELLSAFIIQYERYIKAEIITID